MLDSFNTDQGWRGHSSSKAKMEVECRVMKQLPSYHIPHFSNIILSDAEGATPLSRMLIFKMSQKDQLVVSLLLHFQIIPVLTAFFKKPRPSFFGGKKKKHYICLTLRVIPKQDPSFSGSSASSKHENSQNYSNSWRSLNRQKQLRRLRWCVSGGRRGSVSD